MANENACYKHNELEFCFTGHSRCKVFLEVTVPDETGSIHIGSLLFGCKYMLDEVTVPNDTGSIHIGSILFCYKYMVVTTDTIYKEHIKFQGPWIDDVNLLASILVYLCIFDKSIQNIPTYVASMFTRTCQLS